LQPAIEAAEGNPITFVIPYRYRDSGWFDYMPVPISYPTALWNLSMADKDSQQLANLEKQENYDWREVVPLRNKEENGHEAAWLRFLAGDNPDYPEKMLAQSYGQVCRRLEQIRQDEADLTQVHIHHWQELNPLVTEALIQLTLGAPQINYNGGLLHSRVRYFDEERKRPGLPEDVAALVEKLEAERVVLKLVNLSPFAKRTLLDNIHSKKAGIILKNVKSRQRKKDASEI
jgi:hypothetical protein